RRRHTRSKRDWSSDVCSSDLRPYQDDQKCEQQYKILTENSCHKIISESHASAKRRNKLENLLHSLHEGDKIIVSKLYALADSTRSEERRVGKESRRKRWRGDI